MTFQYVVLPDLRKLAATLLAKPRRATAGFLPARSAVVTPAPQDPQRPQVFSLGQTVSVRAA